MLIVDPIEPRCGSSKNFERKIQAVCRECTAGCGLWTFIQEDRIVDVQGDPSHPVNRGRLCARGSGFTRLLDRSDRITKVLHRGSPDEDLEALDGWESGMDLLADRLQRAKEQYGAESLAINCQMRSGSDFVLGARRFARLWGTPHVYPMETMAADGIRQTRSMPGRLPDSRWPGSGCLLLVEADLASSHPVLFGWILEAQRRGAKICAVDSQYTPTLAKADMSQMIRPDSGNWLGAALMKILIEEKHCSSESMASRFVDAEAWQASFSRMPAAAALHATGVTLDSLRPMARFLASHGPVMVITGRRLGALRSTHIWPTLVNTMAWTRSPLGGWYPLTAGLADLNAAADIDCGEPAATVQTVPELASGSWEKSLSAPAEANPRVLIFTGNVLGDPGFPFKQVFPEMDLTVSFSARPNPASRMAHMVFPAAAWPEREDLCFSENGLLQWSPRIVTAKNGAHTGLDFWGGLARRFGWEEHFPWKAQNGQTDLRAFFDWALLQSPWMGGVQVAALASAPRPMHVTGKNPTAQAGSMTLMPAPAEKAAGLPEDTNRFPLLHTPSMDTGDRDLYPGMHSGDRLTNDCDVLIHPRIGQALAIQTGDVVMVGSSRESWKAKAWLTRAMPLWMIRSLRSGPPTRVLVYKVGEDPEQAFATLKAMGL
jgi:anaerobic selenocysteine-containing dehydrogenase